MTQSEIKEASETQTTPVLSPSERLLARFSRVTSGGKIIPEFEGVRTYGIFMVILIHMAINLNIKYSETYPFPDTDSLLSAFFQISWHAVELFFLISGFILACPFIASVQKGRPIKLRNYYIRRLTRIEPPYLVCLVLVFILMVLGNRGTISELLPHLGASLLYMHNLTFSEHSLINNVAWSLEVEVQFYLLVPLFALMFRIKNVTIRRGLMLAIAIVANTYSWLNIAEGDRLYLSIVRFLHFFMMGFLLADIYLNDWKTKLERHWKWDIVTFVGWPVMIVIWITPEWSDAISTAGKAPVLDIFGYPVFMFLFYYCGVLRGVLTSKILSNVWVTTIGGMSYTLYLFHNKIISIMIEYTGGFVPTTEYFLNLVFQIVLVVPVILVFSAIYFLLVERPCMRQNWPQTLWDFVTFRTSASKEKDLSKSVSVTNQV
ncbi:MAG: acyltransferase [Candidatus Latescibacteria bacterium]|nr:acyltransferase [Candidatus Latescibacterota bacterium]